MNDEDSKNDKDKVYDANYNEKLSNLIKNAEKNPFTNQIQQGMNEFLS